MMNRMACVGGCIGGAGCLTHEEKNKAEVDKYGREAYEKTIRDAIGVLKWCKKRIKEKASRFGGHQ